MEKAKELLKQETIEFLNYLENSSDKIEIEKLKIASHKLKGGAGMLGLQELAVVASEIEEKCKTGNFIEVAAVLPGAIERIKKLI